MIEKFTEGGRSGSFFYFSEDSRFIVKTLTQEEAVFLVKWMPRYVDFMSKNPNTLLCRFCGFHSLTLYNLTIHFMVMQSVYQTSRKIHERYDLKGSYIDRHADLSSAKQSKLLTTKQSKRNPRASSSAPTNTSSSSAAPAHSGRRSGGFKNVVYKDNDLNRTVRLSEMDRQAFLDQVQKDAYFLRDSGIMDYSLLLGVHHTSHIVPAMSPLPNSSSFAGAGAERLSDPLLANEKPSAANSGHIPLTPLSSRVSNSFGTASIAARDGGKSSNASQSGSISGTAFTKDEGGVQASIIEGQRDIGTSDICFRYVLACVRILIFLRLASLFSLVRSRHLLLRHHRLPPGVQHHQEDGALREALPPVQGREWNLLHATGRVCGEVRAVHDAHDVERGGRPADTAGGDAQPERDQWQQWKGVSFTESRSWWRGAGGEGAGRHRADGGREGEQAASLLRRRLLLVAE
jgi:hypothetical protein